MNKKSVCIEMLDAIEAQTEIFQLISRYASELSSKILEQTTLPQENFWRTRRYRSVLLTFDVNKPKNKRKHPYGWLIYYDSPRMLHFSEKLRKPDRWKNRLPLDLESKSFFELEDDDKRKLIYEFVGKSFSVIKSKRA